MAARLNDKSRGLCITARLAPLATIGAVLLVLCAGAGAAIAANPESQARAASPSTWTYSPEPAGPWEPLPFHRSNARPERAEVSLGQGSRRIPGSFFGPAIEYNELADYEAEGPLFDRFLSLVQPHDGTPLMLRIGGKSGDDAFWKTSLPADPPKMLFTLDDQWMSRLVALVRRDRLRVMLVLNLAVHSPAMAVAFAQAAIAALPHRSLAALEVGNEPDLYRLEPGLERERISSTVPTIPDRWTVQYSPADYRRDYNLYARALVQAVPGVPLAGPETSGSTLDWMHALTGLGSRGPELITSHRYASTTCAPGGSVRYPSMLSFLGEGQTAGLARSVAPVVRFSRRHHSHARITEVNTVSCGGVHGVTDTFATALWAADALFEMVSTGVSGVNWETRPTHPNAPFRPIDAAIRPFPELYGLATFAQMIGPRPRLLATKLTGPADLHLDAWVVQSADATRILLVNRNARAVATRLRLGRAARQARVRWLWAAAADSTSAITLGGQTIGSDARWHGRTQQGVIRPRKGAYTLTVPGYSAALVTLAP